MRGMGIADRKTEDSAMRNMLGIIGIYLGAFVVLAGFGVLVLTLGVVHGYYPVIPVDYVPALFIGGATGVALGILAINASLDRI